MNGHTISTNIVCVNGKCKKTTNIHKNEKCRKVYDRLINKLHHHKPTRLPHFDESMDDRDPLKLDIPLISMPRSATSKHKRSRSATSKHKRSRSATPKRKRSTMSKQKKTKLAKISKQLASLNKTMKQLKHSK